MVLLSGKKCDAAAPSKLKVCASALVAVASAALVLFLLTVDVLLLVTQMHVHITNGSEMHQFLMEEMEGVYTKMYLFNISNAERFMAREDRTLKLKEVGPFTYKEVRYNEGLEIDEEEGVIRYSPRIETPFVPEESIARPEDVNLTLLNIPMLGLASHISSYPYWTRLPFNLLTSQLHAKPTININTYDFLWGYVDPLVTLGHSVVPGLINFEKFGILDRVYSKKINKLVVGATEQNKFIIQTRNGHRKLEMAEYKDPDNCELCNTFENSYEGIGYPSPVTPSTPIRIFRNGLCRILDMVYHETKILENNVEALVFNLSDSFYSLQPNESSGGLLDVSDCYYGLPISLTKSHFRGVDPKVYERIEGMEPESALESFIVIEPRIAMELETVFVVQLNLVLNDLSFNSQADVFSNLVVPIGYLEIIQPPLPEKTQKFLRDMYILFPRVKLGLMVGLTLLAVASLAYCVRLILCRWMFKGTCTTTEKSSSVKEPLVNNVLTNCKTVRMCDKVM